MKLWPTLRPDASPEEMARVYGQRVLTVVMVLLVALAVWLFLS
jgi:hypothetical protein